MTNNRRPFFRVLGCVILSAIFGIGSLSAQDDLGIPANLGGGLRQLAAWHAANVARLPQTRQAGAVREHFKAANSRVQMDGAGRVVVDVYLNGADTAAAVRAALEALGAKVIAFEPAGRSTAAANGVLSVYLPLAAAEAAAKIHGVRSVVLVHRPWHHAGLVTSQGVVAMRANLVFRSHFTGRGISVGVLSDSYDATSPHVGLDIARDDLPGPGNRAHRTTPVFVLNDGDPTDPSNIDEGRALLQIVHDVAPDAALAFSTVGNTQSSFAGAIRGLRTDPGANCDILVDDIGFPDEPFFSDGIVEKAVDDVVTSTTLAGKRVLFYSAAGNEGDLGFEADFSPVADSTARSGQAGTNNLHLDQVPSSLTAGGFENFTPGNGAQIAQKIVISGADAEFDLQWDDVFDSARITSDYNLLVFDSAGNYLSGSSGTDDNFSTGQAVEFADLTADGGGADTTFQIAIARTAAGSGAAHHLRYVINADGNVSGDYLQEGIPTIVGHSGARHGDAVGAYRFNRLAEPEAFSSFGPVTIFFDDNGNRLQTPEVRQQPRFSGPDGVATAMAAFRPFFGTSAAAPHVAGVAALLLQASGGPGSLSAAQMRSTLEMTARTHDLDPLTATAGLASSAGSLSVVGQGDDSAFSSQDPTFFTIQFTAPAGTQLLSVAIDLSTARLKFDVSGVNGIPFTIGSVSGGVSSAVTPKLGVGIREIPKSRLTLRFADFPAGGALQFGIDRDIAATSGGGNSANALARGIVTAAMLPPGATKPVVAIGRFVNVIGTGYTPADGFGLIDANAALHALGH